jgi:hypothetical protein
MLYWPTVYRQVSLTHIITLETANTKKQKKDRNENGAEKRTNLKFGLLGHDAV